MSTRCSRCNLIYFEEQHPRGCPRCASPGSLRPTSSVPPVTTAREAPSQGSSKIVPIVLGTFVAGAVALGGYWAFHTYSGSLGAVAAWDLSTTDANRITAALGRAEERFRE